MELENGDLLACGWSYDMRNAVRIGGGYIQKTNSTGELLWRRFYHPTEGLSWQTLGDVDVLSNGDIIAVGDYIADTIRPSQHGWMIRLDRTGCFEDSKWCGPGFIEEVIDSQEAVNTSKIIIYPNPARQVLYLEINSDNPRSKHAKFLTFTIYDALGREVSFALITKNEEDDITTYQLGIESLQSGLYFVKIRSVHNEWIGNLKFVKE